MTCQWDRSWTPTTDLGTCDWVACLRPPLPPASTNLRVTHWFGDPIPFGEDIMFVCERGYYFEEDYNQHGVNYTCQDGLNVGLEHLKGFFNIPEKEEDWPRCLLAPMCSDPPPVPIEGVRELINLPLPVDKFHQCSINDETLVLQCDSFLNVFVTNVTYGREKTNGLTLCDGDFQPDIAKPSMDCFDDSRNQEMRENLRNECNGLHECRYLVPTLPLPSACDGKRREVRVEYLCGK